MTKRQAMREAHRIAYERLEQALDQGVTPPAGEVWDDKTCLKVENALDALVQRHFEASESRR